MFGGKFDFWQVYRICRVLVVCFYIFVIAVKGPSPGFRVWFYHGDIISLVLYLHGFIK